MVYYGKADFLRGYYLILSGYPWVIIFSIPNMNERYFQQLPSDRPAEVVEPFLYHPCLLPQALRPKSYLYRTAKFFWLHRFRRSKIGFQPIRKHNCHAH